VSQEKYMPIKPRLDFCRFHHIVNREVDKTKAFKTNEDKGKSCRCFVLSSPNSKVLEG